MPSKEIIEEIAFIIRHDGDGSPEDTARDILEVISAALQEPTREMYEIAHKHYEGEAYLPHGLWKAMLAASALGEQSE